MANIVHQNIASGSITFTTTFLPGDFLVLIGLTTTSFDPNVIAPAGCGATWSRLFLGDESAVWVGVNPTTGGVITTTGANAAAVWQVRGSDPHLAAVYAYHQIGGATGIVAGPPTAMSGTQATFTMAYRASPNGIDASSTPTTAGWTPMSTGSNYVAGSVPGPAVTPVSAAVNHNSGSQRSFLQVTIGAPPPAAPTALVLTPTETTIDASWTAPAGIVDGYTISLAGGVPVDIGNVTSWTFSSLTPGTIYSVDVRAYGPGGTSAPVSGSTTTLSPVEPIPAGDYTVDVRIGDGPDAHEWTVTRHSPASYGPVAGLALGWTAPQDQGWPTQPNPSYAALQVITAAADELGDVDQGTPLWVRFTPDPDCEPEDVVVFSGPIRDLSSRPHELGQILTVKALDNLLDPLLTQSTGTITWVVDQPINDRYDYLENLLDTSYSIPGFEIPADVSGGFFPDGPATPSTVLELLVRHLAYPLSGGRNIVRPNLLTDGTLDPDQPFILVNVDQVNNDPASAIDAGVLPTQAVEWNRLRYEPNAVDDPLSGITERPHPGTERIVKATSDWDGLDTAWILNAHDTPAKWRSRFRVLAHLDYPAIRGWFDLPSAMNQLIEISNIDPRHNPNGTSDHAGLLAGAALVVPADGDWYVDFDLRRSLHGPTP